jgi:hypothetical protein
VNTVTRVPLFWAQGGRHVLVGEAGYLVHSTTRPGIVSITTAKVSVSVPVEGLTVAVFDGGEWTSPDGLIWTAVRRSGDADWLVVTVDDGRCADAQLYIRAPLVRSHLAEVLLAVCTAEPLELTVEEMDWLRTEDGRL